MRPLNLIFDYPVSKLLAAAKENRTKHASIYEEAMANYKVILKAELKDMLNKVEMGEVVSHSIKIRKPEIHVEEYDQAIKMLEMTYETEVKIDGDMFARLVLDKWDWQSSFLSNTTIYSAANFGIGTSAPHETLEVTDRERFRL